MIPDSEPLMQHYIAATRLGPDERLPASGLPRIMAKRIRSFNDQIRGIAKESPGLAMPYAAFSFDRALESCSSNREVVRETGQLLVDLFLSHKTPSGAVSAVRAADTKGVADNRTRHRVYMNAARAADVYSDRIMRWHCVNSAVELGRELLAASWQNWQLLAEALSTKGSFSAIEQRPKDARLAYEEALDLCQRYKAVTRAPSLLTRVLSGLGSLLLELGEPTSADEHLQQNEQHLRKISSEKAPAWVAERLAATLADRAEVARQEDDLTAAEERLTEAVDTAVRVKSQAEFGYRADLASVIEETGEAARARDVLFEMTGIGLLWAAGLAAMPDGVVELAKCEAVDQGAMWVADAMLKGEDHKTASERQRADVERLLNLDPELVSCRIEALKRRMLRLGADDPDHEQVETLVRAWQTLRVLQRMALQVSCKRSGLKEEKWEAAFPQDAYELAGLGYSVYDLTDDRDEYRIMVRIEDAPTAPVNPFETVSIADKIGELRDAVEKWQKRPGSEAVQPVVRWSFAFRSLGEDEMRLLSELQESVGRSGYEIGAPPYAEPMAGAMRGLDPETQKSMEDHARQMTLGTYGLTIRASSPAGPGDQLERRVAHVLEALMDSLTGDGRRLGYCQIPRGIKTWLDCHLKQQPDEVARCNTFYIVGRKWRDHCGSSRCRTYNAQVPTLKAALKKRNKDLAQRRKNREQNLGRKR